MSDEGSGLWVGLPEPVGRPARLGPFASGRGALKFAGYAGVGAVVAGATTPLAWLPFLGAGLAATVLRLDGKELDAHVADYARYRARSRPRGRLRAAPEPAAVRGGIARGPHGKLLAVLETGGVPVAFLPRRESVLLFERYRTLLAAPRRGLFLTTECVRVPAGALALPPSTRCAGAEREAREGHREMLRVLGGHLRRRQVLVVLWAEEGEAGGIARLEEAVESITGHLLGLGLTPRRLRDAPLGRALARIGWGELP